MNRESNLEKQIFIDALERPEEERDGFLRQACGGDDGLLQRVRALLDCHDSTVKSGDPAHALNVPNELPTAGEGPGSRIGPYKLLQQIGEGGCGTVFMAEQEHPIRRRVALKVIKLGMDTKSVVARFEAERQALSLMDHPHIARVLDAGATDSGRPFFAMELVKGIPITRFCNEHRLDIRQRLDLFIKVCQAVQHAHQKGVIHRDLKPSNILVSLHDPGSPGVPKVIDFGIAKAIEGRLTEKTLFTAFEQFIGTPAYMSPEQAHFSGLDIDTRSDIYSLGVLLYELLTGRPPFDPKELIASGIDSIRKTIREVEPPRPSTRLSTLAGNALTTAALNQGVEPDVLIRRVRGDLDWIVMKCLEKDRTRRYETANGLASDLLRHLNNEPVIARPPSTLYKFQKAVRRNRGAFAAAAAIATVLIAGIVASSWQAVVAKQALKEAEAARTTAEASERRARTAEATQGALRRQADEQTLAARKTAYNSEIRLAAQALNRSNVGEAQRLLSNQEPAPGQTDLRGWEWRYLWGQTRPDQSELIYPGPTPWSPNTLSFSPDSLWLARGDDGGISVMDLKSKALVWFGASITHPVFFNHGTQLSFVDENRRSTNFHIKAIDLITRKQSTLASFTNSHGYRTMRFMGLAPRVWWHALSPDDRILTAITENGPDASNPRSARRISAWSVSEGRQLWALDCEDVESDLGRLQCLSSDGALLALALPGGRLQVVEVASGKVRFNQRLSKELVTAVAFSPDSRYVLTGSGYSVTDIHVWDARDGVSVSRLTGHMAWVSDLRFSSDGRTLISSSADQTIRLWRWPDAHPERILRGHQDEIHEVLPSPDGACLVSRSKDGAILRWDLSKPPRTRGYITLSGSLAQDRCQLAFTENGSTIVGVETNGGIATWSTVDGRELSRLNVGGTNSTYGNVSPDGQMAYSWSSATGFRFWDVRAAKEVEPFISKHGLHKVALNRDWKLLAMRHTQLATNRYEYRYEVWDMRKRALIEAFQSDFQGFSMGMPLSLSAANLLNFWRPNGLELRRLDNPGDPNTTTGLGLGLEGLKLRDIDISPDGKRAASVYDEGVVAFWNVEGNLLLKQFRGFMLGAFTIAYSPDGNRVAAGSSHREAVKLWDSDSHQELLNLEGEGSIIGAVRFSQDGRHLLAVNNDGTAHLWTAPTLDEISTQTATRADEGKLEMVRYLAFEESRIARAITDLGRQHPHVPFATRTLQHLLASNGRPRDAIGLESPPAGDNEEEVLDCSRITALQLWFGLESDYAITRRGLLDRVGNTASARVTERTSKACSLLPFADPTQAERVIALAENAVRLDTDPKFKRWGLLALGMAEYRAGRHLQASERLRQTETMADASSKVIQLIAGFYRSMALHQLGRHAEALELYHQTVARDRPLPTQLHQVLAGHRPIEVDPLIAWLAHREAQRLIEGTTPSQPSRP